ncbi:MAG: DHH family phosphoesterase [Lachnospiraceae bacterium]|nr:DHH family phosphoesterase [Lachnospiraceae bacterium]
MEKQKAKGKLKIYLLWPVLLTVLWLAVGCILFAVNKNAAWLVLGVTVLYFASVISMYLLRRKYILKDYVDFAMDYGQLQRKMLKELRLPYGMLDADGMLLWCNDEFAAISRREKAGYEIRELLPEVKAFSLPKHDMEDRIYHAEINGRNYQVALRMMETPEFDEEIEKLGFVDSRGNTEKMIAVYLYDETDMVLLRQENYDRRLIMGLLYLDNYDEVLESVEEVKRSLLMALVDRKINRYMQEIDAVIKKLEKDKYFFVFQNKYFAELDEKKFSILEEVRSVSMGNGDTSITISMGLGVNADSYQKGYEYARAAIDLALGRGGDQVVVKDGENITYYGGKSESVEKNTRVKARMKAQALREFIENKNEIFIMGHANGDVDSFGSAIGVYRVVKHLGKKAYIVLNEVGSQLRPMTSRFFNNPDYEDDLFISNLKAQELATPGALLVVVDVNRPSLTECPALFDRIEQVIVLDHHRRASDSVENATLSYVEPYASSACELVAEVLQYIGDGLKLRPLEAEAMYAGIMIDTNNFMTKTGVRTFEAAAFLRRSGADVTRIRKAFRSDMTEYMQKAKAISNTEIFMGSFAFAECNPTGVESPTILGAQIANELMEIMGIKASFVFTNYKDKIYISARSIDELNVQVVMERLGNGGGHMSVAGAQLTGVTVPEAMERVKEVLNAMKKGGEIE